MLHKLLIKNHRIISEQIKADELEVLLRELELVLQNNVEGDVVELGCYEGTSALFFQRMIEELAPDKKLWLYDSFEGLPDKTKEDISESGNLFKQGALKASKARLAKNFFKANLIVPEIKKAWFYELDPEDLPDKICYAFLDGDFYESIMDSLKLVWPKMSEGSVIVVDDYENSKLPGVKKAVDEWAKLCNLVINADKSLAALKSSVGNTNVRFYDVN